HQLPRPGRHRARETAAHLRRRLPPTRPRARSGLRLLDAAAGSAPDDPATTREPARVVEVWRAEQLTRQVGRGTRAAIASMARSRMRTAMRASSDRRTSGPEGASSAY